MDKQYQDAFLQVKLQIQLSSAAEALLELTDANGKEACQPEIYGLNSGETEHVCSMAKLSNPLKWTAEHPNLYHMRITLTAKGQTLQVIDQPVGFRTVELKDGLIQVNGRPIHLRGVNRHVSYVFLAFSSSFVLHFELQDMSPELNTPGTCLTTRV